MKPDPSISEVGYCEAYRATITREFCQKYKERAQLSPKGHDGEVINDKCLKCEGLKQMGEVIKAKPPQPKMKARPEMEPPAGPATYCVALKAARKAKGFMLKEVAAAAGLPLGSVCNWFNGRSLPLLDNAQALDRALGTNLAEVYRGQLRVTYRASSRREPPVSPPKETRPVAVDAQDEPAEGPAVNSPAEPVALDEVARRFLMTFNQTLIDFFEGAAANLRKANREMDAKGGPRL